MVGNMRARPGTGTVLDFVAVAMFPFLGRERQSPRPGKRLPFSQGTGLSHPRMGLVVLADGRGMAKQVRVPPYALPARVMLKVSETRKGLARYRAEPFPQGFFCSISLFDRGS